jgi:hypothetical protein
VKAIENIFQGNSSIPFRIENKGMVMAVRTAEIAVGKEKH